MFSLLTTLFLVRVWLALGTRQSSKCPINNSSIEEEDLATDRAHEGLSACEVTEKQTKDKKGINVEPRRKCNASDKFSQILAKSDASQV